jgi:hypothetical protein
MKVTRSRVLVLFLIVGLIVVYASLLSTYVNHKKTQVSLEDQIDSSVKTLSLLPAAPVDSQKRLDEAQRTYDAAVAAISNSDIDLTMVIETLIKTAIECNIRVNPTTTDQWMERTLGLTNYRILPVTLELKGSPAAIISFVQRLENRDQFPNLAIESLSMAEVSQTTETTSDIQQATLNLNIMVRLAPKS